MTRPQTLKRIFHELRVELGDELSARELLRLADALRRLRGGEELSHVVAFPDQRRRFEELGLDEALADGGWRVMGREKAVMRAAFDEDDVYPYSRRVGESFVMEMAA